MDDMERAILSLFDNTGTVDAATKTAAQSYCSNLISQANSWQRLLEKYASTKLLEVKFWCLQEIQKVFTKCYSKFTNEEKEKVREILMQWLRSSELHSESPLVKNKCAQIFATVLKVDFPTDWPNFFEELIASCSQSENSIDMFCRILCTIESDIINMESNASLQAETVRKFKEGMRGEVLEKLSQFWNYVLAHSLKTNKDRFINMLKAIQKYTDWIPTTIISNENFLGILYQALRVDCEEIKEMAIDFLKDMIQRKIGNPVYTLEYMTKIRALEFCCSWYNGFPGEKDSEMHIKCSQLVSIFAMNLLKMLDSLEKAMQGKGNKSQKDLTIFDNKELKDKIDFCQQMLNSLFPCIFVALSSSDAAVLQPPVEFLCQYVLKFRQINNKSSVAWIQNQERLMEILNKISVSCKYLDNSVFPPGEFSSEQHRAVCEEEAENVKTKRNTLLVIFKKISTIASNEAVAFVTRSMEEVFSGNPTFQMVEVVLTLMYELGEIFSKDLQIKNFGILGPLVKVFMEKDGYPHAEHRLVSQALLEIASKYSDIAKEREDYLIKFLKLYISENGIISPIKEVSDYGAIMFTRFAKKHKDKLAKFTFNIINALIPVLKRILESPQISNSICQPHLDNRLGLFESVGYIIAATKIPEEQKEVLISLLKMMMDQIEESCKVQGIRNQALIQQALFATLNISKGFPPLNSEGAPQLGLVFSDCLEFAIKVARLYMGNKQILETVVKFYNRMLDLIEGYTLKYSSEMVMSLTRPDCSMEEIKIILNFLSRLVMVHKNLFVDFLVNIFPGICEEVRKRLGPGWDNSSGISLLGDVTQSEEYRERADVEEAFFELIFRSNNTNVDLLHSLNRTVAEYVLEELVKSSKSHFSISTRVNCMHCLYHIFVNWEKDIRSDQNIKNFFFQVVCCEVCLTSALSIDWKDPAANGLHKEAATIIAYGLKLYDKDLLQYITAAVDKFKLKQDMKERFNNCLKSKKESDILKMMKNFH